MRYLIVLFLLISSTAKPEIRLEGTVLNQKNNSPIAMVNVYDSNSEIGEITDRNGKFSIILKDQKTANLTFSHIAFNNYHQNFDTSQSDLTIEMNETLIQLDDVVITSTRTGYLLRDVPIATEVIGSKEIDESGAITVGELLSQRSGVSSSLNVDGGESFNMLGLDSKYILILKNNQPITGKFNNRVDLNQISIARIKKIEIIKGPGSAIYGSEAMGGIVNIVTEDIAESMLINFSYRASSFGETPKQISSDPINSSIKNSIVVPINNFTIANDITLQYFTKGQQFEYINSDEIDKINFNTDVSWKKLNHQINLSHQYFNHEDEGATRLSSGTLLFTNATSINRNQLTLSHNWDIKEHVSIEQTMRKVDYSRRYKVINTNEVIDRNDITEENNFEYELLFNHQMKNMLLNGGFEFSKPQYKSDRITGGNQTKDILGVFNQATFNLSSVMDIVAGIRLDNYNDTTVFSPRLAFAYKPNIQWTFRTAYGHGFRAPSFMESLIDWEHVEFGYSVKGNPDLKPEVSKGITLGAEYRNNNNFQLSSLFYHNSFSNLIKDYTLESGVFSYRNIESADFTGIELIAKWIINNSLTSTVSVNYLKNQDSKGNPIPNTMPLSFGGRLSYSPGNQKFLIALNLKGVGEYSPQEYDPLSENYISSSTKVDPYLVGDLQIIYRLSPYYRILIGSKNIGNHINKLYGPYIGRTAYIEINTNIERD